jgi:hypothetical protein
MAGMLLLPAVLGLLEEEKQGKVISTNILTCVMRELRFFC